MDLAASLAASLRRRSAGATLLVAAAVLLLALSCSSDSGEESSLPGDVAYLLENGGSADQPEYSLRAVDPVSLADLDEFAPIILGKQAQGALSPDGRTFAVVVANLSAERVVLYDLERWEVRSELGCVFDERACQHTSTIQWGPAGKLLYFTAGNSPQRLMSVDVETGDVRHSYNLPFSSNTVFPSPDSSLIYVFGGAFAERGADPVEIRAEVAALDSATGEIVWSVELPSVVTAKPDAEGSGQLTFMPAAAMSPDGTSLYVAHADELMVSVVDLAAKTVRQTRALEMPDGDDAITDKRQHMSGGVAASRELVVSPDNKLLYLTDWGEISIQSEADRVLLVDTESLEVLNVLTPSGAYIAFGALGKYTYAHQRDQLLTLEADTTKILGSRAVGPFSRVLTSTAPE